MFSHHLVLNDSTRSLQDHHLLKMTPLTGLTDIFNTLASILSLMTFLWWGMAVFEWIALRLPCIGSSVYRRNILEKWKLQSHSCVIRTVRVYGITFPSGLFRGIIKQTAINNHHYLYIKLINQLF